MPNSVTYLNRTHVFEYYMVRRDSKNGYQKDMYSKEIGLHAQNMITIISSIVNLTEETYMTI